MLQFWNLWTKESKLVYLACLGLLFFSIFYYALYYFLGANSVISWDVVSTTEKIRIPIDTFTKGIFDFVIEADSYLVFEQYVGSDFNINLYAAYFYFGIVILALLLALTTLTFLNNWLYYFGTTVVLGYFIAQQPDVLFADQAWGRFIQIAPVLFIGGTGYFFFAYQKNVKFSVRFLVFLLSTAIYYSLLVKFSPTSHPLIFQLSYGAVVLVVIALAFIFFIAYEIVYAFLTLISNNKDASASNRFLNFSLIFALYMLNLVLQYFKNTRILHIDLIYISPFIILVISAILGIWGFKERSVMFTRLLPFYPFGAVVYVAWGVLCFATIGYYMATGNDSLVEVFEDFILFTHIGFGIAFFLYIIGGFPRELNNPLVRLNKVVYANRSVSFYFVYGTGLLLVFAMFSYSNMFTWYQAQAGYYNGLGDAYYVAGNEVLAQEYYQKAASFEFQNHKSNYALATIYKHKNKPLEAISHYKKATLKQPSAFAYANLSSLYREQGKPIEAIFALKDGLADFPKSGELQNNLGLLYKEINFADSAVMYFNSAEKVVGGNNLPQVNKLGTMVANGIESKNIIDNSYAPYRINRLAHHTLFKVAANETYQLQDTVLTTQRFALINNFNLYTLKKADTIRLTELSKLAQIDTNRNYVGDIEYLKALLNYYNGSASAALRSVDNLQLSDQYTGGFYLNTIGLWTLKNDVPRFAADIFQLAYDKGSKTSLLHKALALMECGKYQEAIRIFASNEITNDPDAAAVAERMSKIFAFQNFNAILLADDADKYLVLHYKMTDFSDNELGNLFFSFKDPNLKLKAGVDLFNYYSKNKNIARCGEIVSELSDKSVEKSPELYLMMLKYWAGAGNYTELESALPTATLNEDGKAYTPYFEAKILENNGNDASAKYLAAFKRLPFDENIVLDAAQYFQEKQKNSAQSFNILLDAVALNPYSATLYKAYCLQAINYGIPSFADNGLAKLHVLIGEKEYKSFLIEMEKQKEAFNNTVLGQ